MSDINVDDEDSPSVQPSRKRHKKGKHKKEKKHKKKKDRDRSRADVAADSDDEDQQTTSPSRKKRRKGNGGGANPHVKLKIKFGGQTMATAEAMPSLPAMQRKQHRSARVIVESDESTEERSQFRSAPAPAKSKKGEDDESRWLDALHSGELNERGDLPSHRVITTARQMSMLGSGGGSNLLELPLGPSPSKVMNEEMQARKVESARRRRQREAKRREEQKKQTVTKLITKQTTTKRKDDDKSRSKAKQSSAQSHVHYVNGRDSITLSLPIGLVYPIDSEKSKTPPPPVICAAEGCGNAKKYSCRATNVPLCSLECYRKIREAKA